MKILVADDYDNFRILLAAVLRQDGHDVVELRDGPSLLSAVLAGQPDIVITELAMPGISAIAVLERIRAKNIAVPILVTTTAAPEELRTVMRELLR